MSDRAPNTRPPNWVCQPPDPTGVQRPMRYHATRVLVPIHSQPKTIWYTRIVNAAFNLIAASVYNQHRCRDLRSDLQRNCHTPELSWHVTTQVCRICRFVFVGANRIGDPRMSIWHRYLSSMFRAYLFLRVKSGPVFDSPAEADAALIHHLVIPTRCEYSGPMKVTIHQYHNSHCRAASGTSG